MKILVAGSSGMIGSKLVPFLKNRGDEVRRLVRKTRGLTAEEISWDPISGRAEQESVEGFDAVINLAGENITSWLWSAGKKKRIKESRVLGTKHLLKLLRGLKTPPKILMNASAIAFYGNQGDLEVTEKEPAGKGFLADLCREWEEAAKSMKGTRVVLMRLGIVLSNSGGILKRLVGPFKLGLGGVLGSGEQYVSWIAIDDLLKAMVYVLEREELQGAFNFCSPHPVTNAEFTERLGRVLQRPTRFSIPVPVLRFIFGEIADEMLLTSTRVIPQRLLEAGFQFSYPDLEKALEKYTHSS